MNLLSIDLSMGYMYLPTGKLITSQARYLYSPGARGKKMAQDA